MHIRLPSFLLAPSQSPSLVFPFPRTLPLLVTRSIRQHSTGRGVTCFRIFLVLPPTERLRRTLNETRIARTADNSGAFGPFYAIVCLR